MDPIVGLIGIGVVCLVPLSAWILFEVRNQRRQLREREENTRAIVDALNRGVPLVTPAELLRWKQFQAIGLRCGQTVTEILRDLPERTVPRTRPPTDTRPDGAAPTAPAAGSEPPQTPPSSPEMLELIGLAKEAVEALRQLVEQGRPPASRSHRPRVDP